MNRPRCSNCGSTGHNKRKCRKVWPAAVRARWEYLFVETNVITYRKWIDMYGRDGWELFSVVKVSRTTDRCYFKRPVENA